MNYLKRVRSLLLSQLVLFVLVTPIMGQEANSQPAKPCSAPQAREFDFWIGAWELTWNGPQMGVPEGKQGKAVNVVQRILGGCVIQENFTAPAGVFLGKSWSVYNPANNAWKQTWVDNSGSYLLFSGGYKNGSMELRTDPVKRNEKILVYRMVFKDIAADSLKWDWQRSGDGGKSWVDVWNIRYVRKN
jgi:hypothetical protein